MFKSLRRTNFKRRIVVIFSVFVLLVCFCFQATAATYLIVDGFSFQRTDNSTAVIFKYNYDVSELIIPEMLEDYYVTEIGNYAFKDSNISTVSFDKATHLRKLGSFSFSNCQNLKSIYLPESIDEISPSAFQNCTSLSEVKIKSKISQIPNQAFTSCISLKSLELPDTVTKINSFAFSKCTSLVSILIPKSVTDISDNAFSNSNNAVIKCYRDSYALQYAIRKNLKYEIIDDYLIGDVNKDGKVNITDATEIQKYLAQLLKLDESQKLAADIDKSGKIDINDVTIIQKYIVGLITI